MMPMHFSYISRYSRLAVLVISFTSWGVIILLLIPYLYYLCQPFACILSSLSSRGGVNRTAVETVLEHLMSNHIHFKFSQMPGSICWNGLEKILKSEVSVYLFLQHTTFRTISGFCFCLVVFIRESDSWFWGSATLYVCASQHCLCFLAPLSFSHLWQHDIQVKSIITYPKFWCYTALISKKSYLYWQLYSMLMFLIRADTTHSKIKTSIN